MDEEQKVKIAEFEKELTRRAAAEQQAVGKYLQTMDELIRVFELMKANKPNDRSEYDRCWAIAITDMQKVVSFFKVWVAA
jgi:uncharacterized UPF0160 family protein